MVEQALQWNWHIFSKRVISGIDLPELSREICQNLLGDFPQSRLSFVRKGAIYFKMQSSLNAPPIAIELHRKKFCSCYINMLLVASNGAGYFLKKIISLSMTNTNKYDIIRLM